MNVVLLGLKDGLARLVPSNGHWTAERVLTAGPVESVVTDPRRPGRAYACAGVNGLWRTDDAGATWAQVGEGITRPALWTVAVSQSEHASDGSVVYVGTQLSAIFRSEDGGRTFRELPSFRSIPSRADWAFPPEPDTHHVVSIVADPDRAGVLLVGIELGGVVRSTDGGETWQDADPIADPDPHTMVAHPAAPGRVYLSGGVSYCESTDSGESWTRMVDGLDVQYFDRMAVDPGNPGTMVISAGHDPITGHGAVPGVQAWSTLYRRVDDSAWTEVTDGLPPREGTAMGYLGVDHAQPGGFYYATEPGGLYRSTDGGASWEAQQVAWASDSVKVVSIVGAQA